jgi:hypothetical protein
MLLPSVDPLPEQRIRGIQGLRVDRSNATKASLVFDSVVMRRQRKRKFIARGTLRWRLSDYPTTS